MRPLSRRAVTGGLGLLAASSRIGRAAEPTKITLGFTATLGVTAAFIAKDHGFFAARGLDVEMVLIALNSTIPAALTGGSLQIGAPTPSVLLQANDGGLDLVVVSGCSGIDPDNHEDGLMVRKGAAIAQPADLVGKRVGVPGLNAIYHVLVRKWLDDHGVDWRRVNFVEVAFSQSADVLRSGSVDAVATGAPFAQRIAADGIGRTLVSYAAIAAGSPPSLVFAATRAWAAAHPIAVHAFGDALIEGIAFQAHDPAGARASASKFVPLPPAIIDSIPLSLLQAKTSPEQMRFWIDIMTRQDMLQEKPDLSQLLFE